MSAPENLPRKVLVDTEALLALFAILPDPPDIETITALASVRRTLDGQAPGWREAL